MNPLTFLSSFLLVVGLVVVSNAQSFAQDITGQWTNFAEDTKILIYKGRKNTKKIRYDEDTNKYYGRVVSSKTGKLRKDQKIIVAFSPQGGQTYKFGKLYHQRNDREYDGYLQLKEDGTLKIRKFIAKTYVGTTEVWTRTQK
jgi:uncharacterized protein (DUF2147 family)